MLLLVTIVALTNLAFHGEARSYPILSKNQLLQQYPHVLITHEGGGKFKKQFANDRCAFCYVESGAGNISEFYSDSEWGTNNCSECQFDNQVDKKSTNYGGVLQCNRNDLFCDKFLHLMKSKPWKQSMVSHMYATNIEYL